MIWRVCVGSGGEGGGEGGGNGNGVVVGGRVDRSNSAKVPAKIM